MNQKSAKKSKVVLIFLSFDEISVKNIENVFQCWSENLLIFYLLRFKDNAEGVT
jgi:hypothetical protein